MFQRPIWLKIVQFCQPLFSILSLNIYHPKNWMLLEVDHFKMTALKPDYRLNLSRNCKCWTDFISNGELRKLTLTGQPVIVNDWWFQELFTCNMNTFQYHQNSDDKVCKKWLIVIDYELICTFKSQNC